MPLARLEAKPGKEVAFLKRITTSFGRARNSKLVWMANRNFYFWNFDTFETEEKKKAHLEGKIAEALMANAPYLKIQ
jgi:hypothetical protein